jgi:hypothetical protein
MSAPTEEKPVLAPPSTLVAPANLVPSQERSVTPAAHAGISGAAVGLGVGLLFAELVVPGVILAVIGLAGLSACGGAFKPLKRG